MVGMGAKIFELDGDVQIAEKLSDGCVWAYESTTSGIMPEFATALPCESTSNCSWNQTQWWLALDPQASSRDKMMSDYYTRKEKAAAEKTAKAKEADRLAAVLAAEQAEKAESIAAAELNSLVQSTQEGTSTTGDVNAAPQDEVAGSDSPDNTISTLSRRQQEKEVPKSPTHNFRQDFPNPGTSAQVPVSEDNIVSEDEALQKKLKETEDELAFEAQGGRNPADLSTNSNLSPQVPPTRTTVISLADDPNRPLTHEEAVLKKLEKEGLPPGFVKIGSKKYILRPEAIESVWYMYRITGDPIWQDKGWEMFESIIAATNTKFGHSAIKDVLATYEDRQHLDEMESFWLAETLKYFYLLYSTPDTLSLDEWVLNTEAHPFKRPV